MNRLLCLLVFTAMQTHGVTIDTWILTGQSNAEGYGITENPVSGLAPPDTLESIGRSDLNLTHTHVRMYTTGSESWMANPAGMSTYPTETWHAMLPFEGLCYDWGKGLGGESGRRFGPELAFGYKVQRYLDKEIAILKCAHGSATLASGKQQNKDGYWNDFDPTDSRLNQYDKLIATVTNALNTLPEGDVLKIQGILWMQGEGDANARYAGLYETNLTGFISGLRNDLSKIAASSGGKLQPASGWDTTKFYIGKIAPNGTHADTVRAAMDAVAAADPNVSTIDARNGMSFLMTDDWQISGLHYDTAGQVLLGTRFAEAVIADMFGGVNRSNVDN